ncbi:transketolase [Candidatus Poribacteria bacterium]|nr:transketolase [Candidatus Poribacteria bacterium]
MKVKNSLDQLCVNTIKTLAIDAVQKADSGHPGAPMGLAPVAYTLWTRFLKHNPKNPNWHNRDRFVLSAGHASMLLYSLLHLTGYNLPLEQLKQFRQWESKTPGHPEHSLTPGVETTTGPLGQGLSNSVGMAIAERWLAEYFNKPGYDIVDHYTYVIASDGDMMEGITSEASSLAGHLGLSKLIVMYDDNRISIEGSTDLAFSESVKDRYKAYGWHVQNIDEDADMDDVAEAIKAAQDEKDRPSIIVIHTHIADGSPNMHDTADAHGSPLGEEEVLLTKKNIGWPTEETFFVPEEALNKFRKAIQKGEEQEAEWSMMFDAYTKDYPELAKEWNMFMERDLPEGWEKSLPIFPGDDKPDATRSRSGKVLNAIAPVIPNLVGGSADLAPSTKTYLDDFESISKGKFGGRNLHFGVREHGMGGIVNGMTLHGGLIPYGATFLVFSDYMRPTLRLAAIMEIPSIFVFTHDSIGVGEDGPTHQPVEHFAALRAIPNLLFIRPADGNETAMAWKVALESKDRPVTFAFTRQKLPTIDQEEYGSAEGLTKGAYILSDCEDGKPDIIIMATGSEVTLVLDAAKELEEKDIKVRVVSMPCWNLFEEQDEEYKNHVLPPSITARLAVEAGISMGWYKYIGESGDALTQEQFGASAPGDKVYEESGFTVENIVNRAMKLLKD